MKKKINKKIENFNKYQVKVKAYTKKRQEGQMEQNSKNFVSTCRGPVSCNLKFFFLALVHLGKVINANINIITVNMEVNCDYNKGGKWNNYQQKKYPLPVLRRWEIRIGNYNLKEKYNYTYPSTWMGEPWIIYMEENKIKKEVIN